MTHENRFKSKTRRGQREQGKTIQFDHTMLEIVIAECFQVPDNENDFKVCSMLRKSTCQIMELKEKYFLHRL